RCEIKCGNLRYAMHRGLPATFSICFIRSARDRRTTPVGRQRCSWCPLQYGRAAVISRQPSEHTLLTVLKRKRPQAAGETLFDEVLLVRRLWQSIRVHWITRRSGGRLVDGCWELLGIVVVPEGEPGGGRRCRNWVAVPIEHFGQASSAAESLVGVDDGG